MGPALRQPILRSQVWGLAAGLGSSLNRVRLVKGNQGAVLKGPGPELRGLAPYFLALWRT